jgi:hypothetical protein
MTCEDAVKELMSTMKFSSSEETESFKAKEIEKCQNS